MNLSLIFRGFEARPTQHAELLKMCDTVKDVRDTVKDVRTVVDYALVEHVFPPGPHLAKFTPQSSDARLEGATSKPWPWT